MSDNFITVNVLESKPVYSTTQSKDDQLRELLCGITIVDPNNNQPINLLLDEQSTRITILGGLQFLGELGDPVAIEMVKTFVSHVQIPETEDSDEPDSNPFQ